MATVTAKTIGGYRIERALPYLIEAFSHQSPLRDWEPREAIVRAIGLLGQRNDVVRDLLRQAGTDTDPRVARAAAEAYFALFQRDLAISPRRPRPLLNSYFEIARYQQAIIETEKGNIVLTLHPDKAPLTTDNFVRLAREGFFTGLTFHRLVPNFVAQSGCPRGDGWGGPGYTIRCEVNSMPYRRGTVGMALSGKDPGGSPVFITYSPEPPLEEA